MTRPLYSTPSNLDLSLLYFLLLLLLLLLESNYFCQKGNEFWMEWRLFPLLFIHLGGQTLRRKHVSKTNFPRKWNHPEHKLLSSRSGHYPSADIEKHFSHFMPVCVRRRVGRNSQVNQAYSEWTVLYHTHEISSPFPPVIYDGRGHTWIPVNLA